MLLATSFGYRRMLLLVLLAGLLFSLEVLGNDGSTSQKHPKSKSITTSGSAPHTTVSVRSSATSRTTSVALSSALSIASTASAQASQQASSVAVPLPSHDPKYEKLRALIPALPPLQRTDEPIKASAGEAASNTSTLSSRSEEDISAMLDAIRPPRPASADKNLTARAGALRVLIVGDSMTQGQQGDWTWRYRIWQWFTQTNNIAVNFVGPYSGTVQPQVPHPPVPPPLYGQPTPPIPPNFSGGYAIGVDPAWSNARHFGAWGRAAAVDQFLIQEVVEDYAPDLMLLMLGFNDLGWFYSDSSGTLNSVYNLIENARLANPNIAVAVANIPQRTSLGRQDLPANTNLYNQMLAQAVPYWTSSSSPVALVHLQENYNCGLSACPSGYDGLHPNALGEYQIAQAFSQTLHSSFGYGSGPIQIPSQIPARNLPAPSNFKVQTSPQGVTATWDAVYGAYGYEVMSEITGVTNFSSGIVQTNRYDQQWPLPNTTYSMYVRSIAGNQNGPWTQTLSAVAQPQTAPAPVNVQVQPTNTGITVSWNPPTGPYTDSIILYNVILWDIDTDCTFIFGNAFKSSPATITGLNVGHRYFVAVETWNANGEGFPLIVNQAVPGYGLPAVPSGFSVISQDPTSVYVTWNRVPNAGGYIVYTRDNYTNGSFVASSPHNDPCFVDYFLFPGSWNYQFCVSAFNGNLETFVDPWPCAYAPSPTATMNPEPTCPGPTPWCANGGGSWGPPPEDPSQTGTPPGEGGGVGGGGGQNLVTTTVTINGKPTTIVETVLTVATTDASGHIVTVVIIEPTSAGPMPSGASLVTLTTVGSDGTTTLLEETVFPIVTTNSAGQTVTSSSTQLGFFPTPTPGHISVVTTTNANGQSTTYTETIVPTTEVYSGKTYTGTITEGPSSSTTPIAGLTTYTTFPSSLSWSTTSAQYNTDDGHGHPVFPPWPICWFCPPGISGFWFWNWPGPGVWPPGPPPPGFPDPFPRITIGPNGIPTYPPSPSPTNPTNSPTNSGSSSSCQNTATATSITYYVSYYLDGGGSTTATNTYSTSSSTTTGCTVSGTTVTSTTVGTYSYECNAQCTGCLSKRDIQAAVTPTPAPKEPDFGTQNANLSIRDVPVLRPNNPGAYYGFLAEATLVQVPLEFSQQVQGKITIDVGITSSRFLQFTNSDANLEVSGLEGCTSLIVVSRQGAYATHFWEGPGMKTDSNFQADVINYLSNGRPAGQPQETTPTLLSLIQQGIFGDASTRYFIMTPAEYSFDINGFNAGSLAASVGIAHSLFGSTNDFPTDRLTPLVNQLAQMLPGVPFNMNQGIFVYQRQTGTMPGSSQPIVANVGQAYGKAAVAYSNDQTVSLADGTALPENPQTAAWQCYMQGTMMGFDMWNAFANQQTPGNGPGTGTGGGSTITSSLPASGSSSKVPTSTTSKGGGSTTTSSSAAPVTPRPTTSSLTTTVTLRPTTTQPTHPPPTAAASDSILLFSDSNCQNFLFYQNWTAIADQCYMSSNGQINSYIVGNTENCGCPNSHGACSWRTWLITTDGTCAGDGEVGGGCAGIGGITDTTCLKTTSPAIYFEATEGEQFPH